MDEFYYFMVEGYEEPFGYVHSSFVTAMKPWPATYWSLDHEKRLLILLLSHANDFRARTKAMRITLDSADDKEIVDYCADEKFPERFPVYASKTGELVLNMNGCGVDLFGVISNGVQMIAYVETKEEGRKFWVPRRAKTKMSYPGMLDIVVGGSLTRRESAFDCLVREAREQVAIPEACTTALVKACGTLSYKMDRMDDGREGCRHQVQYLYEMELPEGISPRPKDGEVEELMLMGIDEIVDALRRGEFKLNCGMTWMSYLVRHGIVNAENEKSLVEICARMHRKHDLFIV